MEADQTPTRATLRWCGTNVTVVEVDGRHYTIVAQRNPLGHLVSKEVNVYATRDHAAAAACVAVRRLMEGEG